MNIPKTCISQKYKSIILGQIHVLKQSNQCFYFFLLDDALCYLSDKHAAHNLSNSEKFLQFPLAVCLSVNNSREKGFNYPTPKVWMKTSLLCLMYVWVRHEHSPILKLSILGAFKSSENVHGALDICTGVCLSEHCLS